MKRFIKSFQFQTLINETLQWMFNDWYSCPIGLKVTYLMLKVSLNISFYATSAFKNRFISFSIEKRISNL